ncbi:hypothetical protein DFQ07_3017 [Tenacibaculum caenipelagi]|uniref:Uncharacterized protein n=1 Tax=Tenacibaculum caenipelagi TaxID=1325435 RepID=A0A4R6T950_9FLAO|nr:hypothetical protein DFQ07_3017 [Tenacibaculum caenipelagi]
MDLFKAPLYSQLIVALLSCFFLIKRKSPFLKLLTLFLVVTFFVELTGAYLSKIRQPNFWVYHFYNAFEYIAIFFLYENLLKEKKYLKISYGLLFLLILLWVLTFFYKSYTHYTIIIGSFNTGVLVFLYLRELLLSNEIINYKELLPFWVSVGFLVFHLPAIPFFSFWSYMKNKDLFPILYSLIVLMNVIISFGLLWSNRKVEY